MRRLSSLADIQQADESDTPSEAAGFATWARVPRRSATSWNAEDWCRALQERFFTKCSDGLPVLFCVDEQVLAEIYGGNSAEAIDSITEAVRQQLGRGAGSAAT